MTAYIGTKGAGALQTGGEGVKAVEELVDYYHRALEPNDGRSWTPLSNRRMRPGVWGHEKARRAGGWASWTSGEMGERSIGTSYGRTTKYWALSQRAGGWVM